MNTQTTLQFHGLPETWILALLVLPALLAFSCYVYDRPHSKPILRRGFRSIRFSLLALALFLSFGPHWKQSETVEEPAALAILLDNSASMQHADTTDGSRLLQMQSILQTPNFQDLKHLYSVSTWSFGKQLSSTSPFGESLQGDEPETDIADALRNLQTEFHGQDLARILLLSDGRDTNREPLDSTGTLLAESGIRVDALVFGETQETPDIILERIQGPEFILVGDDALFRFQLRCNETAIGKPLLIRLFNSQGEEVQRIPLKRTPENPINLQFQQSIETAGDHQFQIKAEILPEETATQNNQLTFSFQADPTRIRVLYMDGEPRWEYRYLKNRLLRAKKDIAVTCWLAEASADFEQEHSAGLAPLQRVPLTTEELLAHYDVIILGDIPRPSASKTPPTPNSSLNRLLALSDEAVAYSCSRAPATIRRRTKGQPWNPFSLSFFLRPHPSQRALSSLCLPTYFGRTRPSPFTQIWKRIPKFGKVPRPYGGFNR